MISVLLVSSFITSCASSSTVSSEKTRTNPQTIEYSYSTGCYQAYQRICGKLLTDEQRGACHDDGLAVCEKYARDFSEWIRSGAGPR